MKKVKDYMSKNVIFCSPDDTIFDVAKKLSELDISGMPVVEEGKVVGMISVSDIVKYMSIEIKVEGPIAHGTLGMLLHLIQNQLKIKKELEKIGKTKVREIMTKKVISINPEASLFEAASLLKKYDITRLPVIESGKLVGIISKSDLVRALVEIE